MLKTVSRTRLVGIFLVISLIGTLSACQWVASSRPNILLIAVEGLDFDSVSCLQDGQDNYPGLAELCKDSVRFTHAYTPSVMSQAGLASILTARYPSEHGVRHNGSNFLSEEILTVAEAAIQKSYKTSFFSGGAPIFRKSGLAQGFEVFEDNIAVGLGKYYRPAKENISLFLRWMSGDAKGNSFFSLIYLNDLLFYKTQTSNDLGVDRSLTRESQLKAIDVALSNLFKELKSQGLWSKSYIFLVGLNGQNRRWKLNELPGTNLFSENSQVTLMIKPARRDRDEGIEWSIDANVSLVDVGATLFSLIGAEDFSFFDRSFKVVSLATALERPKVSWEKSRPVLTESGWALWHRLTGIRSGVRRDQWFYLFGDQAQAYNALIDRNETNPLKVHGLEQEADILRFQEILKERKDEEWTELPLAVVSKLRIGQRWSENKSLMPDEELELRALLRQNKNDRDLIYWLAETYIQQENWSALSELSNNHLDPIWILLSGRLAGNEEKINYDPCVTLLQRPQLVNEGSKECPNELLKNFMSWVQDVGTENEARRTQAFIRSYYFALIDDQVGRINLMNGLPWDVNVSGSLDVSLINLVMLQNQFKKFKVIVDKSIERLSHSSEVDRQN